MTTTRDIAASLVAKLGGNPNNAAIVRAVQVWIASESGNVIYGNNPLNMRPGNEAQKPLGTDAANFAVYATLDQGITATAQRLSASDWRGYNRIAAGIKSGSVTAFYTGLVTSAWDASHYGGNISKLMSRYNSSYSYNSTLSFANRAGSPSGASTGGSSGGGTFPPASSGNGTYTTDQWNAFIAALHKAGITGNVSASNAAQILSIAKANGIDLSGIKLSDFYGKTLSDIRDALAAKGVIPGANLLPDVVGTVTGFVGKLFGFAAGLIIVLMGIWLYSKGTSQSIRIESPGALSNA